MSTPNAAETDARAGAPSVGAGVSLLVLLTISMQIVLGGDGPLGALRGDHARDCVRRLPTAMVRVIRDLAERRELVASERAPAVRVVARGDEHADPAPQRVSVRAAMGEWLLDLPPPGVG